MIKAKKKICKICKQPSYLFSKGCCKSCWQKAFGKPLVKSNSWIKPHSEKQIARVKEYQVLRDAYLLAHLVCECCGQKPATEVHHKKKRQGNNLFEHFLAVDRDCHRKIENNPQWAYENGYSIQVNGKEQTKTDSDT